MNQIPHILIVDDEPNVRKVLGALLEQAGYTTTRAANAPEALDLVRAQDPDLILTDLKMPGMDGLELLRTLTPDFPEIPVVMLTAHGTVANAVEAMKRGAFDFLTKPFDKAQVLEVIGKAVGRAERARRDFQGPPAADAPDGIIGNSPAMERLRALLVKVAPSPSTILITGETGTGKELVAEVIHRLSPRTDAPLVRLNCGALPENLVESELFGHEKGAFTGAETARPGRFELADGGTLFLDEVGELPPPTQVKLLRVLQDGRVDRVGGTQPRQVDARIVAATNRDLATMVAEGQFRQDLWYRLQVVEVAVPALRERREDVPALAEFFLDKHAGRLGRPRSALAPEALAVLTARDWPGNVRELENAMERALLLADGPTLTAADFEEGAAAGTAPAETLKAAARAAAAAVERRLIRAALAGTEGNVTRAAELLGLSRRGLQLKMKELGLRAEA